MSTVSLSFNSIAYFNLGCQIFFKKSVPSPNFFPLPSSPSPIHHGNILISSYFLIDQSWDPLDAAPSGQSPDGGLGDALYVVPQHLHVPLGSTLTQPLPSLAPPVPTHGLDLDRTPIDLFPQRNAVIKFRECLVPVEYIYIYLWCLCCDCAMACSCNSKEKFVQPIRSPGICLEC